MTKKNFTHISIIIDRSGSMYHLKQSTLDGFAKFLEEQKAQPGEATLQVVMFNEEVNTWPTVSLAQCEPITPSMYQPEGNTALQDALGMTITSLGLGFASQPEKERPSKVIIAVITDGLENASRFYTSRQRIADTIKHQQDVYGWEFIFLGANMDAVREAANYGMNTANAMNFAATHVGNEGAYTNMSRMVRGIRN